MPGSSQIISGNAITTESVLWKMKKGWLENMKTKLKPILLCKVFSTNGIGEKVNCTTPLDRIYRDLLNIFMCQEFHGVSSNQTPTQKAQKLGKWKRGASGAWLKVSDGSGSQLQVRKLVTRPGNSRHLSLQSLTWMQLLSALFSLHSLLHESSYLHRK